MMNNWIFFSPVIGAIAGWLIHHLVAIYFFQNILPKKKKAIARSLGQLAQREFSSMVDLGNTIRDPRHFEKIKPTIEKHVDEFLRVKLGKEMPVVSMFIGEKTIESMKKVFLQELQLLFPEVIGQFAGNISSHIDLEKQVAKKFDSIPDQEFSEMIRSRIPHEINTFRWLGAFTGLIVGLILLGSYFLTR